MKIKKFNEISDNGNKNINESYNFGKFKIGDIVKVTDKDLPELSGKEGEIIDIDNDYFFIYIDFKEDVSVHDKFKSSDLDGRLEGDTGLVFVHDDWITHQFLVKGFSTRNLEIINK